MTTRQMADVSSILQHTPNGVLLVDEQARVRFANPAFCKMFRTGEEELVGRAINPAHQNPNLPRQLGIKAQVIQAIAAELRRQGKQITIEYY